MIPNLTHNALQNGFGHFGVASKSNKTRHVDTLGVTINSSNSLLTCFVIKSDCKEILDYLKESGRISFFVGMISHEAYNFKGQFEDFNLLSKSDLEISENYRSNVINIITNIGMPREAAMEKYGIVPDIGITFKVDKVFVQTPGPDAGKLING